MDHLLFFNLAAEVAVKTSVVLGLTVILAMFVWRGSSASIRHGIWSFGIYAAILVPVFVLAMPGWGVLPPVSNSVVGNVVVSPAGIESEINREADLPESPGALAPAPMPPAVSGEELAIADNGSPPIPVSFWIVLLWGSGVLVLLGRIGLGFLSLIRLGRSGRRVRDGRIVEVFEEARDQMGMVGRIRILTSTERVMPMSWGILSPTILLPAEASEWGRGRLYSVLLHEMAHLERGDPIHHFGAKVACAFYWFHPLVWFAAWRQQAESEVACDDRVLELGVRGSDYAAHLLEVVTGADCSSRGADMAMAMARSVSQLESRVASAVDPGKNRRRNSKVAVAVGGVLALGFVVPVSMLTAAAPEAPEEAAPDPEGNRGW